MALAIMVTVESATPASQYMDSKEISFPVVVGLGGNLGDVRAHFRGALASLRVQDPQLSVSRLYKSDPLGPAQPDFLNAAALFSFASGLEDLLGWLHQLEHQAQRRRLQRWGPRTLDLDVLWAGDRVESSSTLTVPHLGLTQRGFALLPLLDLVPDARDPLTGQSYEELISPEFLSSTRVVSDGSWWLEPTCL